MGQKARETWQIRQSTVTLKIVVALRSAQIHTLYMATTNSKAIDTDTWTDGTNSLTVTQLTTDSYLVVNSLGRSTVDNLKGWQSRAGQLIKLGWKRIPHVY